MNNMTLEEALASLDPSANDHWTKAGQPAMAYLESATGNKDLTREEVDKLLPGDFSRDVLAAKLAGGADDQTSTSKAPSSGPEAGENAVGNPTSPNMESAPGTDAGFPVIDRSKFPASTQAVMAIMDRAFDGVEFDAVALMEATVAAAQSDRFRRNGTLQDLCRGYQVSQPQIRDLQARLDARQQRRNDLKPQPAE